ncbi:hypothetical protein GTO89_00680 [Heliobacterium gestii]|uniref:Carotenoid biosynthesis protein n=1 Tax=Heliomicrobium gestii TaxID=2699 RepID=A0A845LAJ7_HELGE|nr:CBO0543 family protein [Heliomicrobium gestii]MBM7865282.1 hypothetical protein [Heliomicrobium gestii]MZP41545.1 hypothetical protein [Heliomicrobium gestii]
MNIGKNIETVIFLVAFAIDLVGAVYIARINWKRYGLLFFLSALIGSLLCYLFLVLGYYEFSYLLFPGFLPFPFESILTAFSFYVLLGVCYSPKQWAYKIPFYWTVINLGVFAESLMEAKTEIIKYQWAWDFWDSYSAWWIYLLLFEWLGGKIIPPESRRPIPEEAFRFGRWAWFVFHGVMLPAAIGIGIYLGSMLPDK